MRLVIFLSWFPDAADETAFTLTFQWDGDKAGNLARLDERALYAIALGKASHFVDFDRIGLPQKWVVLAGVPEALPDTFVPSEN